MSRDMQIALSHKLHNFPVKTSDSGANVFWECGPPVKF